MVPNLMQSLPPWFRLLDTCYYYWAERSKSPYSKHQLAASQDVVQEGEISGYLKENQTKTRSVSVIFTIAEQKNTRKPTESAQACVTVRLGLWGHSASCQSNEKNHLGLPLHHCGSSQVI